MIRWLRARWHARLRRIDLLVLWPALKELAPDLDQARLAFMIHAMQDASWSSLGESALIRIIGNLE